MLFALSVSRLRPAFGPAGGKKKAPAQIAEAQRPIGVHVGPLIQLALRFFCEHRLDADFVIIFDFT